MIAGHHCKPPGICKRNSTCRKQAHGAHLLLNRLLALTKAADVKLFTPIITKDVLLIHPMVAAADLTLRLLTSDFRSPTASLQVTCSTQQNV